VAARVEFEPATFRMEGI